MKFPVIVISLLLSFPTIAQSGLIRGTVVNEVTREPLSFASIQLMEDGSGSLTNASGKFSFLFRTRAEGNLIVSYLGYAPKKIIITAADTTRPLVIFLKPEAVQLNEISVRDETPLSIVQKCISRFDKNYSTHPYTAEGFQREHVKSSENFIQLLEVNFMSSGTPSNHSSVLHQGKYIEDKAEKRSLWSSSRGGFYTFGWTDISGIEAPDKKNFLGINTEKSKIEKYYDFAWDDQETIENTYVIRFDQKKNIRRALLRGHLYIDEATLAIVKITYELSPRGLRWLKPHETWGNTVVSRPPKKITIKKDRAELTYRRFGSKWYFSSHIADASFNASLVFFGIVQGEKTALSFHSECVVTAIDTMNHDTTVSNIEKTGSIPTLQNFVKKEFESYEEKHQRGNNLNFIQSDTSFAFIAAGLKIKNREWESENRKRLAEKCMNANLSRAALQEDLHYLKASLEKIHPGLNLYTSQAELERSFYNASRALERETNEAGFLRIMGPLIEKIHCGHTIAYPSNTTTEWLSLSHTSFPVPISFAGDSAIVTQSHKNIPAGSRLLSINGTPIAEIISKLKTVVPADGWNETYKTFQLRKNFPKWLAWYYPHADSFDIAFESNKLPHQKRVGGIALTTQEDGPSAQFHFYDSISTLLLTIPTFETHQKFNLWLEEVFKSAKVKQTKNLVIDIRNNEGGRDECGALLFSFIAKNNFDYYKNITVKTPDTTILGRLTIDEVPFNKIVPDYTTAINQEGILYYYSTHPNLLKQSPSMNAFEGQVYILINGGTYSSAAEFASIAHSSHRAIFIGEETGGAYHQNCSLGTPTLTLPHSKLRINIPLGKYSMVVDDGTPSGHGVIPDHLVRYTTADLLEGRDKEMELCLQLIK